MLPMRSSPAVFITKKFNTRKQAARTSHVVFVVAAIFDEAALLASRVLRLADFATVANNVHVDFVEAPCRDHRGHQSMSFFVRALFWNQRETTSYAKDVSINREYGAIAGEKERAGDCLRADAFEA